MPEEKDKSSQEVSSASEINPTLGKPKRNWKKTALFMLTALLLTGLIGIGLYIIIPKQPKELPPSQNQSTSSAKTSVPSPKKITESKDTSCFEKEFKMAFILVAKEKKDITNERLEKIERIKSDFPGDFSNATQNLAEMDTLYPTSAIIDDGGLIKPWKDGYAVDVKQVAKKFYEKNSDNFHFLSIYTTFETPRFQDHTSVQNKITNIGQRIFDHTAEYGSKGKLLGINHMRIIDNYTMDFLPENNITNIAPGLTHETGHQWCCFLGDFFEPNNIGSLPIRGNVSHLYHGLSSPYQVKNELGSAYWLKNKDGTYRRDESKVFEGRRFHPFILYFMGLLGALELKDQSFSIYNAGTTTTDLNTKTATYVMDVDINDVINYAGGERACS